MGETMTAPVTQTYVVGDPEVRSKMLWIRELMRKAKTGFTQGVSKVRVTITRVVQHSATAAVAAGAQIGLATRAGWNGAAHALTGGIGLAARGAIQVARAASWVGHQVGKVVGWFTGLFSKKAGKAVRDANQRFTDARSRYLDAARGKVKDATFIARAAITSKTASTVGRATAGVLGAGTLLNVVTKGAVVSKAVGISATLGKVAGIAFGPAGLLVTGAVALLGGLGAWLFRRNEVTERAFEIIVNDSKPEPVPFVAPASAQPPLEPVIDEAAEEVAEQVAEPVTETVLDEEVSAESSINEEGEPVIDITGSAEAHEAVQERVDEIAREVVNDKLKAMGLPPMQSQVEVTKEQVIASLEESGVTKNGRGQEYGGFSKTQFNKRRGALIAQTHPMPQEPVAASA